MAFNVLIAGHSQAKYFETEIEPEGNVSVVSYSGYRVEEMWER